MAISMQIHNSLVQATKLLFFTALNYFHFLRTQKPLCEAVGFVSTQLDSKVNEFINIFSFDIFCFLS